MGILIFLLAAAIYNWKYRFIPGWLYVAAAIEAVLWRVICQTGKEGIWEAEQIRKFIRGPASDLSFGEICGGIGIGLLLLFISKKSDGAIGKGDGLTFMITGIYLGLWRNLCLLWFSLILCSLWGAGLMVIGRMRWKQVKKKELPFLPFVFPVGVWLTIL